MSKLNELQTVVADYKQKEAMMTQEIVTSTTNYLLEAGDNADYEMLRKTYRDLSEPVKIAALWGVIMRLVKMLTSARAVNRGDSFSGMSSYHKVDNGGKKKNRGNLFS